MNRVESMKQGCVRKHKEATAEKKEKFIVIK